MCSLIVPIIVSLVIGLNSLIGADAVVRRVQFVYSGLYYESAVTQSELSLAPVWSTNAANPPLPARSAVEKARTLLIRQMQSTNEWKIDRIALEPVGMKDQWVYIVDFTEIPKYGEFIEHQFACRLIVLMNGKVAPIAKTARRKDVLKP